MFSFTSKDTVVQLVIGGAATLDASTLGIVGPFPRYSISREDLSLTDGSYLSSKFSITVTGTATLKYANEEQLLAGIDNHENTSHRPFY